MILRIKQEDIDKGVRADARACPIALALKRKFPESKVVKAGYDHLYVSNGGTRVWNASFGAKSFIRNFDFQREVDPTWFLLWRSR